MEPASASYDAQLVTEEPHEDDTFNEPSPEEFVVHVNGLFAAAHKHRWRAMRRVPRAHKTGRGISERLAARPWLTAAGAFTIGLWVLLGTFGALAGRHTTPRHIASSQLIAKGAITHTDNAPDTPSARAARPVGDHSEIARPAAPRRRGLPSHRTRAKAQPAATPAAPAERASVTASVPVPVSEPAPPPPAMEQTSGGPFSP